MSLKEAKCISYLLDITNCPKFSGFKQHYTFIISEIYMGQTLGSSLVGGFCLRVSYKVAV